MIKQSRLMAVAVTVALALFAGIAQTAEAAPGAQDGEYYTEAHVYGSRPRLDHEMSFECIGATGIKARIYRGVKVTIEGALPGSPAEGRFKVGQVITGINGEKLKGRNPFVALGSALTAAEATDGRMVFEVTDADGLSAETIALTIPVLGAYSDTWPLRCEKSEKIIAQAAEFYADRITANEGEDSGMTAALACLFLLSTGDDAYLPPIRDYFRKMAGNVKGIGNHTWNNGYNGIACAEYYLRTGDRSVLPVLQHFCDDAKARQKFGCGWTHWGTGINPGYVASGLMNPAGSQVLTTLLLSKECGLNVDDETLLGALRFWYRFAGHGTVPYGDHRGEGGLGSNGKDGMSAAAMKIASGAQGDTSSYKEACLHLSMSTLTSYPSLVRGHADEGRGDGIWRGIASSYMLDHRPEAYHRAMNRLQWWHDLSRRPSGALGIATCQRFDDVGSGAGVALSYTAPLKTLRITGAKRSKHAKDFTLPENIWGRKADRAFLSIENNPKFNAYGEDEPIHIPLYRFGCAYAKPSVELKSIPRDEMLKNVHHRRYMIRAQAAKALRTAEAFDALEALLRDDDPRVKRAALDGIIDYNYWFGMGKQALKTEQFTRGMVAAIKGMLTDPNEALYVVDGALMALKLAPAKDIESCLPLIMPWTTHEDWWLRESSFCALAGLQKDDPLLLKVLPTMITMMIQEYHTMPRQRMVGTLKGILKGRALDGPVGEMIMAGHLRAVKESEIKTGNRAAEGVYNVAISTDESLRRAPETAVKIAQVMKTRFDILDTGGLVKLVGAPNSNRENPPYGLYTTLEKQTPEQKTLLTDILYNDYREELSKRMKAGENSNRALIDTLIDLARLKTPDAGWKAIGKPPPAERVWRFTSFDPQQEEDHRHRREKKRFRDVALPASLKGWFEPDFDDSTWQSGQAPIGKGPFERNKRHFENRSTWGDGEFLVMRTSFELDELAYDFYRISVLASQGFHIYLNGHKIHTYIWWKNQPHYRLIMLGENEVRHLKKGTNSLAVYTNTEYPSHMTSRSTVAELGQIDMYLEGLKHSDLE